MRQTTSEQMFSGYTEFKEKNTPLSEHKKFDGQTRCKCLIHSLKNKQTET